MEPRLYRRKLNNWTYKDRKCLTQCERVSCGKTFEYYFGSYGSYGHNTMIIIDSKTNSRRGNGQGYTTQIIFSITHGADRIILMIG